MAELAALLPSYARRRLDLLREPPRPAYVVWELTLRCDQACRHCGSRAGAMRRRPASQRAVAVANPRRARGADARGPELSTAEALEVVAQLSALGASEVVLIGGEAYLHQGFLQIVSALRQAGIAPTMVTGGHGIDAERARAMAEAGMQLVSVSLDGLERAHDALRSAGSFARATAALEHLAAAGLTIGCNTSCNRLDQGDLEGLYEQLRARGARGWQLQLTVPMGRAADRPGVILQPYHLLELMPRIAALKQRAYADGLLITAGNNLGYFGPEEALLRSLLPTDRDYFCGCHAGRFILGIEADGGVKGCLSLQSDEYLGGQLRQQPLGELWQQSRQLCFAQHRSASELWGFCASCPYAATCMAGCSFTSHALFGRRGNNPLCHYRALTFARAGQRERLRMVQPAAGKPMDHGLFEIVVEPLDAADPSPDPFEAISGNARSRSATTNGAPAHH